VPKAILAAPQNLRLAVSHADQMERDTGERPAVYIKSWVDQEHIYIMDGEAITEQLDA